MAISYDQIVKPCCSWRSSDSWKQLNHRNKVDLVTWHHSKPVSDHRDLLLSGQWPEACGKCAEIENTGRFDSMRGNGNHSYAHYKEDDITLEIRPGNTCNFACQTCWPEASSRVAQYQTQAGLIKLENLSSQRFDDFEFLTPIASRIKDVVLLGGEPFYDKNCHKFLSWASQNLSAKLMMFTNGSVIDFDFLHNYKGSITLIFSLDAVGRPAEYIRFGTVWEQVLKNYMAVKQLGHVHVRVNVTCSIYNYAHLKSLMEFLCKDWPSVVSFGTVFEPYQTETAVPPQLRPELIQQLTEAIQCITATEIESGQKSNAVNALQAIINNLNSLKFDPEHYLQIQNFINKMDQVKHVRAADYCNFLGRLTQ